MIPQPTTNTLSPTLISAKCIACRPTAVGSTIATSSSLILSGTLITISGLIAVFLVYAPGFVNANPTAYVQVSKQNCGLPVKHASQCPHGDIGKAVTLSPTFKSSLDPGSVTIPQNSCPITSPFGSPDSQ